MYASCGLLNSLFLTADLALWRAVHVAYLGTDQPSLNLNFSKNANMVVAQYYQFLRLGFEGYRKIMSNLMKVSAHLAEGILGTGRAPSQTANSLSSSWADFR